MYFKNLKPLKIFLLMKYPCFLAMLGHSHRVLSHFLLARVTCFFYLVLGMSKTFAISNFNL